MDMRRALAVVTLAALAAAPAALAEPAAGTRSAGDGWIVHVSVEPPGLGPIVASVGRMRPAAENDAHAWLQHDLVLENIGERPVRLADTRKAALLGPPGRPLLLAAHEGCGYAVQPLAPVCLLYLRLLTVEPRGSVASTITLFKGLRGMKPLTPGTYVFRTTIRFQAGREFPFRLVYRLATF